MLLPAHTQLHRAPPLTDADQNISFRGIAPAHKYFSTDYKLNRVIQLTNKIKIKLVNCTNALEYVYEKYQVESYRELSELWEKYVRTKDEERRYRKSTELLEHYNRTLMDTLFGEEVKDAEIWLYQAEALLDEKEMVEVRHHLNIRRQTYNTGCHAI